MPGFENSLAFLFLLWLPVQIAIYFFKVKPKKHVVSSHFLWKVVEQKRKNTTFWEKFRSNPYFWLQILFFFVLYLALSDPYLTKTAKSQNSLIIIDNSASMSAFEEGSTRLEHAKNKAMQWLNDFGNSTTAVYAWNSSFSEIHSSNSCSINIRTLTETHLPRNSFNQLFQWLKSSQSKFNKVFLVTDNLSESEISLLDNLHVHWATVGNNDNNVYINSVTLKNDTKQNTHVHISIKKSGSLNATPIEIQFETKVFKDTVSFDNSFETQTDFSVSPEFHNQPFRVVLNPQGFDGVKHDNLYIINPTIGKTKLYLDNSTLPKNLQFLLQLYFENDQRYKLVSKEDASIYFIGVDTYPESPKPNHLYFIVDYDPEPVFFKSYKLNSTSSYLRYMNADKFSPASWELPILQQWAPLVIATNKSMNKKPVVFAKHNKLHSFCFNLSSDEILLNNLEFPILLENILRSSVSDNHLNGVVPIGAPNSKKCKPQKQLAQIDNNYLNLSGIYSCGSNSQIFVQYPPSESNLKKCGYRSSHLIDQYGKNLQSNTSKESKSPLLPWLCLIGFVLVLTEWVLYCRKG